MFPIRISCFIVSLITAMVSFFSNEINAQKVIDPGQALSLSQKRIAIISALTAKGDLPQLSKALGDGLDADLTINEEKEVLIQLYAYCGFPRSLQGINTLMKVVEERKQKGIRDAIGKQATPLPDSSNKYQRGKATLQTLTGQPEKEPKTGYAAFSPEIEIFLKEHLFADIFSRDVLDYKSREIATVSALISLGGVEPMMKSHMSMATNLGVTQSQMRQLVSSIEPYVGTEKSQIAREALPDSPAGNSGNKSNEPYEPKSEANTADAENEATLFPKGDKVMNEYFSGPAWLQMLVTNPTTFNCTVGNVTFAPGVRNSWHKHPGGQILLATNGTGYYQERGKPIRLLRKGDVAQCYPNVEHWHGAAMDSPFTHIAITTNSKMGQVVWLEKVSDETYKQAAKNVGAAQ